MELIDEVEPLHRARDLVVDLKRSGHTVVLASSARDDEVAHYLDLLDARELADDWTTSEDVESTKPEPDLVVAAIEKAGGGPAVMVGDSVFDCEAARRAGVDTLAVLTGGFSEQELLDAGACGCSDPSMSCDGSWAPHRSQAEIVTIQVWPTGSASTATSATSKRPRSRRRAGRGGGAARFVVQEHHARRLHWDLRLEHEGTLVSWALPRGVPDHPDENRLAVHTEDHPLEYLEFEETSPRASTAQARCESGTAGPSRPRSGATAR